MKQKILDGIAGLIPYIIFLIIVFIGAKYYLPENFMTIIHERDFYRDSYHEQREKIKNHCVDIHGSFGGARDGDFFCAEDHSEYIFFNT